MLLELKIALIVAVIFAIYLVVLYFVNKDKAKLVLKIVMEKIEWLCSTEIVKSKKDWVYQEFNILIDLYLPKVPLAKFVLKYVVKYTLDKLIESDIPRINAEVKPLVQQTVEKIISIGAEKAVTHLLEKAIATVEPTPNDTLVELSKIALSTESKAIYSIFAKVNGNTAKKGVNYEGGASLTGKI